VLEYTNINDFSGGMNKDAARYALSENEFVDAQDCLFSENGLVRRRGPWEFVRDENDDIVKLTTGRDLIAVGNHLRDNEKETFLIITGTSTNTYINSYQDGVLSNITSIPVGSTTPGMVRMGFTAPPKNANDDAGHLNARLSSSVIATKSVTLAAKYKAGGFTGSPDSGSAGSGTENFNPGAGDGNKTFRDEDNEWEFVYISGTLEKINSYSPDGTGALVDAYPYWTDTRNRRGFRNVVTIPGHTLLAGRAGMPQHLFYSKPEDVNHWNYFTNTSGRHAKDFIHIIGSENDRITGLANIGKYGAIFKTHSLHLIETIGKGKFDQKPRASVGTLDQRSIAKYDDKLIFAGDDGIHMFNGSDAISLTENKIDKYWRDLVADWEYQQAIEGWRITGVVVDDYYMVSVYNPDEAEFTTLCCHIPTRSWSRFSNVNLIEKVESSDQNEVFGFMKLSDGETYMVSLSSMFRTYTGVDGDSEIAISEAGPTFQIETGQMSLADSQVRKAFRHMVIEYDAPVATGTISVKWTTSISSAPNWGTATAISPGFVHAELAGPQRRKIGTHGQGIAFRIEETDTATYFTLKAIKLAFKRMREGRS
jgi:hypothetical protein